MAITIPDQIRSLDPYADHRFSNSINRFNRVFTRGNDLILPFDNFEYPVTLRTDTGSETIAGVTYSWTAYKAVKIGPGLCIKDDILIHCKNSAYLSFTDADNYVGSTAGYNVPLDTVGNYFILLKYTYSRSIPAPSASYVIAKQRSEYLLNKDRYLYLATAVVQNTGSGNRITSIASTDLDELNSNAVIQRSRYEFTVTEVDGGDLG